MLPEVPDAIDRFVSRCLEPDPANRYQTTKELAEEIASLDENGEPIPIKRGASTCGMVAAVMTLGVAALAGTWWFRAGRPSPMQHDPVSVLIADFRKPQQRSDVRRHAGTDRQARAGRRGIHQRVRPGGIKRSLGVRPPEKLDERAAQEIAVKQGVGVVLPDRSTVRAPVTRSRSRRRRP